MAADLRTTTNGQEHERPGTTNHEQMTCIYDSHLQKLTNTTMSELSLMTSEWLQSCQHHRNTPGYNWLSLMTSKWLQSCEQPGTPPGTATNHRNGNNRQTQSFLITEIRKDNLLWLQSNHQERPGTGTTTNTNGQEREQPPGTARNNEPWANDLHLW